MIDIIKNIVCTSDKEFLRNNLYFSDYPKKRNNWYPNALIFIERANEEYLTLPGGRRRQVGGWPLTDLKGRPTPLYPLDYKITPLPWVQWHELRKGLGKTLNPYASKYLDQLLLNTIYPAELDLPPTIDSASFKTSRNIFLIKHQHLYQHRGWSVQFLPFPFDLEQKPLRTTVGRYWACQHRWYVTPPN